MPFFIYWQLFLFYDILRVVVVKRDTLGGLICFSSVSFLGKEQAVTFPVFALLLYWFLGYDLKSKKYG